jgi:Sec-independent protein translocase protein TatA
MNLFGMGTMEILVVALVAFIFLGPDRIVGVAKLLGKATKQLRQATTDLPEFIAEMDTGSLGGGEEGQQEIKTASPSVPAPGGSEPVAFRADKPAASQNGSEQRPG